MAISLSERDKRVIWHPYTHQKYAPDPIPVVKGEGSWIIDENGNRYIDAISSWWVNTHGHAHPYIAEKIYRQALQLEQVIFAGFTHEPAIELAERLIRILPGNFSKIFYSDNGSTATEVALKMAIQYWKNKGISRPRILALKNGYHGDTFGAMSMSERGIFTNAFREQLFDVSFADLHGNHSEITIDGKSTNTDELLEQCACVIYEPLVQGAGGMIMHNPEVLNAFLKRCKFHGLICIADEVMTGFGRTGRMFASSFCDQSPDIICLSKGITGGTMAMGVTACNEMIHEAFRGDDVLQTFFHGHSYTANPIACAAALASLDLFEQPQSMLNIERIVQSHREFVAELNEDAAELQLSNIRQTGTILAFEKNTGETGYTNKIKEEITRKALSKNVFLRPLGNTVYLMPPYCITQNELNSVYAAVKEAVA